MRLTGCTPTCDRARRALPSARYTSRGRTSGETLSRALSKTLRKTLRNTLRNTLGNTLSKALSKALNLPSAAPQGPCPNANAEGATPNRWCLAPSVHGKNPTLPGDGSPP